jgi:uncharacterized protein YjbJ (UPF0337 family)
MMNGTIRSAKGRAMQAVGNVTGNDKLAAKGKAERLRGSAEKVAGAVRDAVADVAETIKGSDDRG